VTVDARAREPDRSGRLLKSCSVGALESTTCAGRFTVDAPADHAIGLSTPEGERSWVQGWDPRYPAGGADQNLVGTVFVTDGAHGEVVWVVTQAGELDRHYARFDHGGTVGTVEVRCRAAGETTEVEVTYRLTAMTPDAAAELDRFAAGYDRMLAAWEAAIAAALAPRER
jgi:hypothetical protein